MRPLAAERDIALEQDLHAGLYEFVLADSPAAQAGAAQPAHATRSSTTGRAATVRIVLQMHAGPAAALSLRRHRAAASRRKTSSASFLPFERLDADSTDVEGTGLGLALSRGLSRRWAAAIGVERSVQGEGSTFYVDLPLDRQPARRRRATSSSPSARRSRGASSAAGASSTSRTTSPTSSLVESVFERLGGLELMSAHAGTAGHRARAPSTQPDLILLDLHLPDIDGEEVLRRLRADERMRDIPVIILSADATPAQLERLQGTRAPRTTSPSRSSWSDSSRPSSARSAGARADGRRRPGRAAQARARR